MTWDVDNRADIELEQRDRQTEDFDRQVDQTDRARERTDATPTLPRCWHCGGTGYRCCEFGRDLRADEHRAAAQLHGHRSGTVTAAPIRPPINGGVR